MISGEELSIYGGIPAVWLRDAATEVCQAVTRVSASTQLEAYIEQESYCNSMGDAVALRSRGLSSREAGKIMGGVVFDFAEGVSFRALVFPEEVYSGIPIVKLFSE